MAATAYLLLALVVPLIILIRNLRQRPAINFPRGPPTLPLLGNLHQIPLRKPFLAFAEWGRTYGAAADGLVGLQLGPSQRMLVLNKWQHVRDLIDGRGAVYSDRPPIHAATFVIPPPGNLHLVFLQYGPQWRRTRRTINELLRDGRVEQLLPIQDAESTQMMWELLTAPEGYHDHVMRCFGAVVLASVFGTRGKDFREGGVLRRFFRGQDEWAAILDQGATPPADIFPFLKHVPDALTPWKGWRKKAEDLKSHQGSLYEKMWKDAERRVLGGKGSDSFVAGLLSRQAAGEEKFTKLELDYIGGFMMEAGADTTAIAMLAFILAMAAYPDIQKQAHKEVDMAFERMPHAPDTDQLPFLKACLLETLRWRPGFPMAIPHATSRDDTYLGYFIPKGTTVVINTWALHHDPDEFDRPEDFNPSRYLANPLGTKTGESAGNNVDGTSRKQTYAFGGGRRICAGQKMAENSLILTMAKLVWSFDITPGDGARPNTDLMTGFKDAILTGPEDFSVQFHVRSNDKQAMIQEEWKKADMFLQRYE